MEKNHRIIGAFGFWPLTREAFEDLLHGRLDEGSLKDSHFARNIGSDCGNRHLFWYIGAIETSKQFQYGLLKNSAIAARLIKDGLSEWITSDYVAIDSLKLIAIGFTKAGHRMLISYGFKLEQERDNGHHTYFLETSLDEIREKIKGAFLSQFHGFLKLRYPVLLPVMCSVVLFTIRIINVFKYGRNK